MSSTKKQFFFANFVVDSSVLMKITLQTKNNQTQSKV